MTTRPRTNAPRRLVARAAARAVCAVLVVGAPAALRAHEIGTTQVTVRLDVANQASGGTYRIDIATDADALLEKLEMVAGQPASPAPRELPASEFALRLAALEGVFRQRVAITFDGVDSRPAVTFDVAAPASALTAATATIRLTGAVPPGPARLVWRYAWTFSTYALHVVGRDDAHTATEWVEGGDASRPYDIAAAIPAASRTAIARQYVGLGLTHIVPHGLDHVLFVLGLFLLSTRWRSVLWQVSAFTLAHSITLGLGMYGVIGAPPAIVEPLIALSIAIVALENVVRSELHPWRVALVFAFGLLHGMGFAGALTDLGLPRGEFVTALVGFNAGVECGQLVVVAAAFAVVGWYQGQPTYRRRVVVPASLAIACVAIVWTIERAAVLR